MGSYTGTEGLKRGEIGEWQGPIKGVTFSNFHQDLRIINITAGGKMYVGYVKQNDCNLAELESRLRAAPADGMEIRLVGTFQKYKFPCYYSLKCLAIGGLEAKAQKLSDKHMAISKHSNI